MQCTSACVRIAMHSTSTRKTCAVGELFQTPPASRDVAKQRQESSVHARRSPFYMPAPGTVGVLRPVRRGPSRWERLTPNPPSSLQPARGRTSPAIHETGSGNSRHEFQLRVMSSNKRSTHTQRFRFPSSTRADAQSTGFHHYNMIQANT